MRARPTPLEAATKALAHRDRSAATLRAYLEQRGAAPEEAERAVERLRDAGYVNDARYATERAEALAGRGYGDATVRLELARAGVGPEEIEQALASLVPERERAVRLLRAAKTPLTGLRRLAAKGFAADSLEAAAAAAHIED
jgi:SOS response regulatory protein OraA/RecX